MWASLTGANMWWTGSEHLQSAALVGRPCSAVVSLHHRWSAEGAVVALWQALIDAHGDQRLAWLLPSINWVNLQSLENTRKALGEFRPPPAAHLPTYRPSTFIIVQNIDIGSSDTWLLQRQHTGSRLLYDHFLNSWLFFVLLLRVNAALKDFQ